jgi:hypothetical protein
MLQALTGANAHVMAALGTNVKIARQFCPVQNCTAGFAFAPYALGHRTPAISGFGSYPVRDQFFKPAHQPDFLMIPTSEMASDHARESLIYSGRGRLKGEVCRFKAQIADNSCSSAKICNQESAHFSPKMHVHE